jgi:predicted PurR-regulated permease PerM
VVLVVVVTIYMLADMPRVKRGLCLLAPNGDRDSGLLRRLSAARGLPSHPPHHAAHGRSAGLITVLATVLGRALLGIVGALVAIPVVKLLHEEITAPRLEES